MRGPRSTEGATLIVVVLFTMLLLAALLAASSQLTLSSRRTTADQAASLRAQYVAESGIALVQSQLRDVQGLLSSKSPLNGSENFEVPGTTTKAIVKTHAENFCGKSSVWVATSEFAEPRGANDAKTYPDATQCVVDDRSTFSSEQASVLADYLKQSAYSVLPASERPNPLSSRDARLSWWKTLLNSTDKVVGSAKYQLRPVRVVQLSPTNYRFFIRAANVRAQGVQNNATRVLAASRTQNNEWWFEIVLPSLLDDVLMTNHHRAKSSGTYNPAGAPGVNFTDQVFDGSIHTNEKFLFLESSSAQFMGKVSSVGCTNLPQTGMPSGGDCTKTAGVYIGSNEQNPPSGTANVDKWVADKVTEAPRTVKFMQTGNPPTTDYTQTDFTAAYKPLPINENDQRQAAQDGGLTLGSNTLGVELVAGGADGQPLGTYDTTTKKWAEPNPTYQYIRFLKAGSRTVQECSWTDNTVWSDYQINNRGPYYPDSAWNNTTSAKRGTANYYGSTRYWRYTQNCQNVAEKVIDTQNEYRVDKDGNLYKKNSSGSWESQGRTFNGVIYGESFQSVRGPSRKDGSASNGALNNVPPAVASFSGLTLAATNSLTIDGDLTVSDTPCTLAETKGTPPCTKRPKNILGLYAQNGDVVLSEKTGNNLNLHASIMSSEGQVTAANFDNRLDQGDVNLLGSVIENWYGAFGTTRGTGYGRNFTYDQRLAEGTVPPFFPVSPRWQAEDAKATGISMTDLVLRQATASDY